MYLLLTVIHTDMMSVVIETGTKIADSVLKLYVFRVVPLVCFF